MKAHYLRVLLRADVNGWDIEEVEGRTHRELFERYAERLRADSASHQADADRMNAMARYADALALVEEPPEEGVAFATFTPLPVPQSQRPKPDECDWCQDSAKPPLTLYQQVARQYWVCGRCLAERG